MARILLVEDDPGVRGLVARILSKRGHQVASCERIRSAYDHVSAGTLDLAICDVGLPDGNGLELVARLRGNRPRLPIMVLSGRSDESDFKRGFAAGADDYIRKPFLPDELLAKTEVLLVRASDRPTQRLECDLPGGRERAFDRYRLQATLGRGSYGTVFRAIDLVSGSPVALKVLGTRPGVREEERLRFVREAYALSSVEHPNVVAVRDFGVAEGRFYYSMDHVEGPTVRSHVAQAGCASPVEALALLEVGAAALCALAAVDLVHRDLTPSNVILRDRQWGAPVLVDFGLAKRSFDQGVTQHDLVLGTPGYIAPEALRGAAGDTRSDLFALGMVVRFALTGAEPFPGLIGMKLIDFMSHHEVPLPEGLDEHLGALLRDLLRIDPDQRPPSPAAVLQRVAEVRAAWRVGR